MSEILACICYSCTGEYKDIGYVNFMFYVLSYVLWSPTQFPRKNDVCVVLKYTTGATSGAGIAYPSGAPEFTPGFWWGSCYSFFSFPCDVCLLRCLSLSKFWFGHGFVFVLGFMAYFDCVSVSSNSIC